MPTDRAADRHPLATVERIESRIHVVRGHKVILDADLHNAAIRELVTAIRQLAAPPPDPPRRRIGFQGKGKGVKR
jgi:hypothetical protein